MAENLTVEQMEEEIISMDNEIANLLIELGLLEDDIAKLLQGDVGYTKEILDSYFSQEDTTEDPDINMLGLMNIMNHNEEISKDIFYLEEQRDNYQYGMSI